MDRELEPITPDDAIELYLTDKQNEFADATLRSHRSRLNYFRDWCSEQDITNLNKISGRSLHRYRLWRRDTGGLAPISEKTQMDTLRVFIRWCETIDAVRPDLSTQVVSPSIDENEDVRDVMLDSEVAQEILDYLRRYEYASARHVCFQLMWRTALRRGAAVSLDLEDYDADDQYLEVHHRPETGTPIKNKLRGERFIALSDETTEILDAWISDRRPDEMDSEGREPLLATPQGRAHPTTIQTYVYSVTKPCLHTNTCPHGRDISECPAAADRTKASRCPSSLSPHAIRRGAITSWLNSDVPETVVIERANVSGAVIDKHYDRRSEREKMNQRRKYLDDL